MSKQLMELVLPRLARPLYRQLQRFQAGQWDEDQFTRGFEALLQRQHTWLTQRGVSEARAALTIHAAVLILSGPGLRAEAVESGMPIEQVEFRAVCEAAADVARNYGVSERRVINIISRIVAHYGG
jgi:hypothetical protein